jgi:glycosyltransferase involved in cell wall biosynthesis
MDTTNIGVNVIGDFAATTGLMEAGRRLLRSLLDAGVSVSLEPHTSGATRNDTRLPPEIARLPRGRPHPIDLLLLNINEMPAVPEAWLRSPSPRHHVIGAWFWELSGFPNHVGEQTVRVDEIWVASTFVRDSFRGIARTPVTVIPPAIEVHAPADFDAARFGIRDDAVVYFFNFDALSTSARKNPWGVVNAFSRAFTPEERAREVQLVIKVHNLDRAPAMAEPLRDALETVNGILINAELTRSDMDGLLERTDVYASLHRSEGFGLGLAEAMYLGKPVIATAYSGNMDFTTPGKSCLVGYSMKRVTEQDHRHYLPATMNYRPGLVWADPDIALAARWMRLLYERPGLRREIGARAAAAIRDGYAATNQVEAVTLRLRAIAATLEQDKSSPSASSADITAPG